MYGVLEAKAGRRKTV